MAEPLEEVNTSKSELKCIAWVDRRDMGEEEEEALEVGWLALPWWSFLLSKRTIVFPFAL